MAQPPAPEAPLTQDKLLPYWRWLNDDFIAQGKVSKTAIVEIFLAIGFYYLVARYSPYPLVTLFTFLTVPLLLLRSEASILRGVELLKQSWTNEDLMRREKWILSAFSFVVSMALCFWMYDFLKLNWVLGHSGWPWFWRIALVLTTVIVVTMWVFSLPVYLLGIFLHAVYVRVRATVTNLPAGFEAFTKNWREMVLVSNFRHAPALIPRAGQVSALLNMATMPRGDGSFWDGSVKFGLKILMFVGATLYRWNIKATSWVWGPIAFGLRKSVWEPHQDVQKRKRAASLTSWITIGAVAAFWVFLVVNWVGAFQNARVTSVLNSVQPEFFKTITDSMPTIPTASLLFCVLTVFALTLFLLLCFAFNAHFAHFAVFSNANDWRSSMVEDQLEGRKDATYVASILKWNLVVAYFFVCTVFFMVFVHMKAGFIEPFSNAKFWNFVVQPQFMVELLK